MIMHSLPTHTKSSLVQVYKMQYKKANADILAHLVLLNFNAKHLLEILLKPTQLAFKHFIRKAKRSKNFFVKTTPIYNLERFFIS